MFFNSGPFFRTDFKCDLLLKASLAIFSHRFELSASAIHADPSNITYLTSLKLSLALFVSSTDYTVLEAIQFCCYCFWQYFNFLYPFPVPSIANVMQQKLNKENLFPLHPQTMIGKQQLYLRKVCYLLTNVLQPHTEDHAYFSIYVCMAYWSISLQFVFRNLKVKCELYLGQVQTHIIKRIYLNALLKILLLE